jgi:hypothetical protein
VGGGAGGDGRRASGLTRGVSFGGGGMTRARSLAAALAAAQAGGVTPSGVTPSGTYGGFTPTDLSSGFSFSRSGGGPAGLRAPLLASERG